MPVDTQRKKKHSHLSFRKRKQNAQYLIFNSFYLKFFGIKSIFRMNRIVFAAESLTSILQSTAKKHKKKNVSIGFRCNTSKLTLSNNKFIMSVL